MKYLILVTILICYILCMKDAMAEFTRDDCIACCRTLRINRTSCEHSCLFKFGKSQDYNSRKDCNRSCIVGMAGCRTMCLEDCAGRYEDIDKPLGRRDKEKRRRQEEREARGYAKRPTKDPNLPKRVYKKQKFDAD